MSNQLTFFKLGGKIEKSIVKENSLYALYQKLDTSYLTGRASELLMELLSVSYTSNLTISDERILKLYYNLLVKFPQLKREADVVDFIATRNYLTKFGAKDDANKKAIEVIDHYLDKYAQYEEKEEEIKEERQQVENKTINSINDIPAELRLVMPKQQQQAIIGNQEIYQTLVELNENVKELPALYAQDGKGKEAIEFLHYFYGGSDWWITEVDYNEGIFFGYAILNGDSEMGELGYMSIEELTTTSGIQLDFFWDKKTLTEALKNT